MFHPPRAEMRFPVAPAARRLRAQVYRPLLCVDPLLPFPPSSVRPAEKKKKKASQEEISHPITGGASTPAAGAPQSEC